MARFQKKPLSRVETPLDTLADFRRERGRKHFPYLSYVARKVIGHQASVAQIERGFSTAGRFLTCRSSSLDTAWVEMQLLLHASFDRMPDEILHIFENDQRVLSVLLHDEEQRARETEKALEHVNSENEGDSLSDEEERGNKHGT